MEQTQNFDELRFFAEMKKRPGFFLGEKSLLYLRTHIFGMDYAFSQCCCEDQLPYIGMFIHWYQETVVNDLNGYAGWWNHILYTSGNDDRYAFDRFFHYFEAYLKDHHGLYLPEVE